MNFDVVMPLVLFLVALTAIFIARKAEPKLKATVEEREFKNRDVALLVIVMGIAIGVVMFIPSMALLALFLFSYSSLLFTVSYAFSDLKKHRTTLLCTGFIAASAIAAAAGFLGLMPPGLSFYGVMAFTIFAAANVVVLIYVRQQKSETKQKWYLAALPPALFLLLFIFFSETGVWMPYLLDVYGAIFAMLIIIYLNSLFTWKTVFIFAAALTTMDILMVWIIPGSPMITAAKAMSGLHLPVMVTFPTVPNVSWILANMRFISLGLGDLFFAGVLASQTLKKFGAKTAVISLLAMSVAAGLSELLILNPDLANALPIKALPETLFLVAGWIPVALVAMYLDRKRNPKQPEGSQISQEPPSELSGAEVQPPA
jgi:hypothetical protein